MNILRYPAALRLVQDENPDLFRAFNLMINPMPLSVTQMVFLLRAAIWNFTKPVTPKDNFLVHDHFNAHAQYVIALQAHFLEIRRTERSLLSLSGFNEFLGYELTQSRLFESKIRILKMILSGTRLFQWDRNDRLEQFRNKNFNCIEKFLGCVCAILFWQRIGRPFRCRKLIAHRFCEPPSRNLLSHFSLYYWK